MTPRVIIESLTFSDGNTINIGEDDIVVFVGPNNAGKSVALRNILDNAKNTENKTVVVKNIMFKKVGTTDELYEWLERTSYTSQQDGNTYYAQYGFSFSHHHAKNLWENNHNGLDVLANSFICNLAAETRISASKPPDNIDTRNEPFTHPIHYMYDNPNIENSISDFYRIAFGQDIIVHKSKGKIIPLYCGNKDDLKEDEKFSNIYLRKLDKMIPLQLQGDGMRSFAGVLLHTLVVKHSIVLIDEPEAFLHPPQARLLGKMLADNTNNRQLFIATHSGDFIRGLLDSNTKRVCVIRIEREGMVNNINELDNEGIEAIWRDSLLRHSNILDGLFHEKVIICESDSDCRFYAALTDAVCENERIVKPNAMFTHCGGKDRIPMVVKALKRLGVQVKVIVDFDVLQRENPLKIIIENLGGNWDDIESDWQTIKRSIDGKKVNDFQALKKELMYIVQNLQDIDALSHKKREIKILLDNSAWSIAKTTGRGFLKPGTVTRAFDELNRMCKSHGLYIVEIGEVEQFVKSVDLHGPKWVNSVLEKNLEHDPELKDAREFIKQVMNI